MLSDLIPDSSLSPWRQVCKSRLMYESNPTTISPPPLPRTTPGNLTFERISSQMPGRQAETTIKCPAIGVHGSTINSTREFVSTAFRIVFPLFQTLNNGILSLRINFKNFEALECTYLH